MVNRISSGLLAALCLVSCFKQQEIPEDKPLTTDPVPSVKVSCEDATVFPSGARISVWGATSKGRYCNYTTEDGRIFNYSGDGDAPCAPAFAVYPASGIDSLYRGSFYLRLKDTQNAVEGKPDSSAFVYAGRIVADSCRLYPLTSVVSFTISQEDIGSCVISSTSGKAVSGPARVSMYTVPSVSAVHNSKGSVRLSGKMEAGRTYCAVVAAEDYAEFDVTLFNSYGAQVFTRKYVGDYALSERRQCSLGPVGDPDISSLVLKMKTVEYAGYTLKSVVAYSSEDKTRLMGAEVGETFVKDSTLNVKFFGLKPKDYSSGKIWYVFTMEGGSDSVVLPVEMDGVNIAAGSSVVVDAGVLSESRNAAPWYYPHEDRRLMSGEGYAFGEANTFLIQYKESSYGTSLDPDPSIPSSVTIDYRVRGDLFAAPRPEDVSFEWLQGFGNSTPSWDKYTMDRTLVTNCGNYDFAVDADNYKVTVTNTGAHMGSPILLMKKDGKVLWAWTFWNIAADGTRLRAVTFGGVKLANMDIGHPSNQRDAVLSKITEIRRCTNYYQWGRPMPTFSNGGCGVYFSQNDTRNASKPRVPIYDSGAITVAEALEHPGFLIQNPYTEGTASKALTDWNSQSSASCTDLWGGVSADSTGVKSIYDPCPKGWRVPDAAAYASVFPSPVKGYEVTAYPNDNKYGYQGVYVTDSLLFIVSGDYQNQIDASKYMGSLGLNYGTSTTAKGAGLFWTNTYKGEGKSQAFRADYYYQKYNMALEYTDRTIGLEGEPTAYALPVRCQLDEDNR